MSQGLSISFVVWCIMMAMWPSNLTAQKKDTSATKVQEQLEKAFEELDEEDAGASGEQLTQFMEDLAADPVNINHAGLDQLLLVPGINLKIARGIIDRRSQRPFENRRELLEVPGIGSATYSRIQPYVSIGGTRERFRDMYVRPQYWLADRKVDLISRYQQNLQTREGYIREDSSGGYLGSPVKYYQRMRVTSDHISFNITQEKDPGETLDGLSGFDYTSAHIAFKENGKLKDLVIGDYSLSFGQGLVLWTGGAFGKGREVTGTVSKNERGLKPYSSAQETDFFRGVAANYGETVQLTVFYSNRDRSASVLTGDTTRFPSSSGFHRTFSELERKNNISQQVMGGRLRLDTSLGLIGASGYYNSFSSYIESGTSLSNRYDYSGSENMVLGIDYRGLFGDAFIFGEMARSQNGGMGAIGGIETPVGFNTDLSLAYRNYEKDFQSFLGDGFGESSSAPQNEEGFYVGLRYELIPEVTISGYFDQYQFAAPRFGTTQSTAGYDVLGLAEIYFNRKLNVYVLIRNEIREAEFVEITEQGSETLKLGKEKRASIRTHLEYQLSPRVRIRSRVEFIRNKEPGDNWESGFLIYQDLRIQPMKSLRIDGRISLFETDSFNTRVYQFESDLLYVLSNTVLYDRGERAYITVKYDAAEFLDIWLKYGITMFEDVQTLGSGLNEVQGNIRNSIGVQVRVQF